MSETAEFITESASETQGRARALAVMARPGWIIGLSGDLGAGKTTFVQGFVEGLGGEASAVTSPTFTLLQSYEARYPVHHFDLYRLESSAEVLAIGFEEFVYGGDAVSIIEWADKFPDLLPPRYLKVVLETITETQRRITLTAVGGDWPPEIFA